MAATPKKRSVVHWALDASLSDFGSPAVSEGSSTESSSPTSSLQYINSQLVAHGFTQSPGLSLEGLQKEDSEKMIKCLLGMLSQRIEDMSRTEELSAKIRTLSYEHERLMSMHKTATDKAANAEREMNTHKSRLASAVLNLQSSENAHKRTTAELQRMRTTLQGLRLQHSADIKKIEKEKERVMERWSKLADSQLKHGSSSSGLIFANAQVVEASDVQMRGQGQGFLDLSLEEAERSRTDLADETRNLKGVILSAANELQRILYTAQKLSTSPSLDEPAPITSTSLFPLAPTTAARDKLNALLGSTREIAERLAQSHSISQTSSTPPTAQKSDLQAKTLMDRNEVEKPEKVVKSLRSELDKAQQQSASYAAQAQDLLERFTAEQQLAQAQEAKDINVQDELSRRRMELEEDQRKFSEAAVKLGKDKAALEAQRIRFLEERRSWQVEKMLGDATEPIASTSSHVASDAVVISTPGDMEDGPPRSPRRSPRKVSHKVKSNGALTKAEKKTTRVSRRSSGLGPLSPKRQAKILPAFETEVIPTAPSIPEFKLSMTPTKPKLPPMTSAFVLPPPSPAASFNPQEAPLSSAFSSPQTTSEIPFSQSDDVVTRTTADSAASSSLIPPSSSAPTLGSEPIVPIPNTPLGKRAFPIAKPFASHMIHAYSPAKPSPLSRILLLANSPESPESVPSLGSLTEETESPDISPTPGLPISYAAARDLAVELGVADDREDGQAPLRDTNAKHNSDKGKARADDKKTPGTRSRTVAPALEKENKSKRSRSTHESAKVISGGIKKSSRTHSATKTVSASQATIKTLAKAKGGARRVPIESAEAAVVAPAWKG